MVVGDHIAILGQDKAGARDGGGHTLAVQRHAGIAGDGDHASYVPGVDLSRCKPLGGDHGTGLGGSAGAVQPGNLVLQVCQLTVQSGHGAVIFCFCAVKGQPIGQGTAAEKHQCRSGCAGNALSIALTGGACRLLPAVLCGLWLGLGMCIIVAGVGGVFIGRRGFLSLGFLWDRCILSGIGRCLFAGIGRCLLGHPRRFGGGFLYGVRCFLGCGGQRIAIRGSCFVVAAHGKPSS